MNETPKLALPYIMASQAQKHITHNESLKALDTVVQLSVTGNTSQLPPDSPMDEECHIIAAGATGGWSRKDGRIAAWQDGAWTFYEPLEG